LIRADFALRRAGLLVTMVPRDGDPLGRIRDAALAAFEGRVVWIGPDNKLESKVRLDGDLLDAQGYTVLPGLVDAHTHPVFAGSRADEFAQRISGVAYADQQSGERGIMRTVRATRAASDDQLLALARDRAERFLAHGTTTIEAKTGYGLELEAESRSLDVLRRLAGSAPLRIVPTFLGAHVVPEGDDVASYVRRLTDEMLPAFRGRARYCDAWCDPPAFTAAQTRAILEKARSLGYQLRVHAAQLAPGDGPTIAAELGAASADHLEYATPEQLRALARAGTVAVLCPSAAFTVPQSPRPPIEAMREAGIAIAIASDLNPGTSNGESLTFAMSLACILWGMTPEEVLKGATVNAARSLGMQGVAGCLRPGSFADLALFDVGSVTEIPYHVGVNRAVMTVVGGRRWCPT
jgi:imidazolonepropionase